MIWTWREHRCDRTQSPFALNLWNAAIDLWPNQLSMWMRWRWHFCRHWAQSHLRCHFHCRHCANQTMANNLLRSPCRPTLLSVRIMHGVFVLVPISLVLTLSLSIWVLPNCLFHSGVSPRRTRTYSKIFLNSLCRGEIFFSRALHISLSNDYTFAWIVIYI